MQDRPSVYGLYEQTEVHALRQVLPAATSFAQPLLNCMRQQWTDLSRRFPKPTRAISGSEGFFEAFGLEGLTVHSSRAMLVPFWHLRNKLVKLNFTSEPPNRCQEQETPRWRVLRELWSRSCSNGHLRIRYSILRLSNPPSSAAT